MSLPLSPLYPPTYPLLNSTLPNSKTATTYDSIPWMQRAAIQITGELRKHRDWLGIDWASSKEDSVRILDYACGTGLVSRAFVPYATDLRGIDISSSMVGEYNRRCSEVPDTENPLNASMHAIVGDLCDPAGVADDLMDKELFDFDVAIVGMGFHHFEHLELSIRRLKERVKKGGVVIIIDGAGPAERFPMANGHGQSHHHTHSSGTTIEQISPGKDVQAVFPAAAPSVPHKHGFSRADMEKLFTAAGCTDFDLVMLKEPIVFGDGEGALKQKAFIARGRRA